MTRISRHLFAASTLLGVAALAVPVFADNGYGNMMDRHGMGDMMGRHMPRGDMAGMCGEMMQSMQGGGRDRRPNDQWRRPTPTPERD
ncbi:hypothetical protein [Limobrevibacterium gyesilva]|uniref:Uncharacterized protein n=1 Tax=Limobrevibacterium gyesilva TaxID=2991712 RepID=A0AA41YRK3_9PROT|nr:hypothetical protein [Limobrevibacterium gyesilva]MCW3477540.1 hypothetical protein [Limobrevibacterium gyesilva]